MLILQYFKNFWPIYLVAICLLTVYIFYTGEQRAEDKLSLCTASIELIKEQGKTQAIQIENAEKEANKIRVDYSKQINQIQDSDVPKQCLAAIQWGIQEAQRI